MAPLLVLAWGNPSRGDDALGPEFARLVTERFADDIARRRLEVLTDFQLQVEHALDLVGRRAVFFVDAASNATEPCTLTRVEPARDRSLGTHAMSPAAVLHTLQTIVGGAAPECWVLAIRGVAFELGASLSAEAAAGLARALTMFAALPELSG